MTGKPDKYESDERLPEEPVKSGSDTKSHIREHTASEESTMVGAGPPADSAFKKWLGRKLDERYEIVELLGEGGMGAVFAAKHLTLSKDVALKVIRPEFAGDGEIAARFAREAMTSGRFEHPNVASAIDFGTLPEGGAYFVMQLARGQRLSVVLENEGGMHWSRAANIGAQLADALSAAAANNIVHRDLKPDNVIIQRNEDGSDLVKILDFGIARSTRNSILPPPPSGGSVPQKLTRQGTVIGTPGYMAPEQAMGDPVGHGTDLYALGVVIWECIAGRRLWEADDLSTLVKRQLTEPVPKLRELLPEEDVPEELDQLLTELMSVSSKDRPEQAGAVRDILRQLSLVSTITNLSELQTGARLAAFSERRTGSSDNREISDTQKEGYDAKKSEKQDQSLIETRIDQNAAQEAPGEPGERATQEKAVARPRFLRGAGPYILALLVLIEVAAGIWIGTAEDPSGTIKAFLEKPEQVVKAEGTMLTQQETGTPAGTNPEEAHVRFEIVPPASRTTELEESAGTRTESGTVPDELVPYAKQLMNSESLKKRVAAADKILVFSPANSVPEYLLAVARLQKANTCSSKKKALHEIKEIGDRRALPALRRLSKQGRSGCGRRKRRDCLACLRQDLSKSIQLFGHAGSQ